MAQVYIELIGGRQSNLELHKDESEKNLLDNNVSRVLRERRPSQELTSEELNKHREFTKNFVKKHCGLKKTKINFSAYFFQKALKNLLAQCKVEESTISYTVSNYSSHKWKEHSWDFNKYDK